MSKNFFSGLSGNAIPGAKNTFPPEFQKRSRLAYYAQLFNSMEVNSSFYRNPQAATVAKWAAAVPDDFAFTFKLSKAITHNKGLAFKEEDVEAFMKIIDNAGDKKGCLLIQFPPSIGIERIDKLQQLLAVINWCNEDKGWQPAVEFRNTLWYERETAEILAAYGAIPVLHDKIGGAYPFSLVNDKAVYLRYHGPGGDYRGGYEDDFLQKEATKMKGFLKDGKKLFCYFNNTMGDAFDNVRMLKDLVEQKRR